MYKFVFAKILKIHFECLPGALPVVAYHYLVDDAPSPAPHNLQ